MQSGRLDQRITIERVTYTQTGTGDVIETWSLLAEVWAAVEPLNGREYFAANAVQSETTTRIRLRYLADLNVVDRINHEGTLYNINSIINPPSGDAELVLMCRAQA